MNSKDDAPVHRCFGNGPKQTLLARYHDEEWGIPEQDDQKLFEFLILEGAQAGLNWETILKKREHYKEAFHHFNPSQVASMTDGDLEACLTRPTLIRNRRKIYSTRQNARVFLDIQQEFGSFSTYLWRFVNNKPIVNRPASWKDVASQSELSLTLSKDLKKRGMSFVGPTIMYSYMQAVGMINDHTLECWKTQGP